MTRENSVVSYSSSTDLRSSIANFILEQGGSSRPPIVYDYIEKTHGDCFTSGDYEVWHPKNGGEEPRYKYHIRFQVHPQMSNPSHAGRFLLIKPSRESGRGIWTLRDDAVDTMMKLGILSQPQLNNTLQTQQRTIKKTLERKTREQTIRQFPSYMDKTTISIHLLSELAEDTIVKLKKEFTIDLFGSLMCEICEREMKNEYNLGKHYAHVHHKQLKSTYLPDQTSKMDDLAILCPNCHNVIHENGCISIPSMRDIYWLTQTKIGRMTTFPNGVPTVTDDIARTHYTKKQIQSAKRSAREGRSIRIKRRRKSYGLSREDFIMEAGLVGLQ